LLLDERGDVEGLHLRELRRHPLTVATLGMQGQRSPMREIGAACASRPRSRIYSKTVALQIKAIEIVVADDAAVFEVTCPS
jgi:hypothetical protein